MLTFSAATTRAFFESNMAAKFSNLPSGKVFLQVLGCGIEDTVPSLFLFTDSKRYLFNCGEGTQRLFTEHKIRISKLNTIFLTQNKWSHIGGFLGLSMTLRDIGKENIFISGPSGLQKVIHGARHFLNKENVNFKVTEYSESCMETFEDDEISIKPVVIYPDYNFKEKKRKDYTPKERLSSRAECNEEVESHAIKRNAKNSVACYIAQLRDYPGKLLPKVAMSLGVPKGPMFRQLKDGQSVTLPNGKIVTPAEVTEAPIVGPSLLVIDCPARQYISGVVNNKMLKEYQVGGDGKSTTVVHLAERDIINDSLYQSWISRFHEHTYHCIVSKKEVSQCLPVFCTQYGMQFQLNQVHPRVFPLIETWRKPDVHDKLHEEEKTESNIYSCKNMSKFILRPQKSFGIDLSDQLKPIDTHSIICETLDVLRDSPCEEEFTIGENSKSVQEGKDATKLRESMKKRSAVQEGVGGCESEIAPPSKICKCIANDDGGRTSIRHCSESERSGMGRKFPFVVFLGTGASIPSKYRNVTSILLHTSPCSTVLLDCGEGSFGQIFNHYGSEAIDIIKKLKFIFISHLHADHHLGLIRILKLHWKHFGKQRRTTKYVPPLVAGPKRLSTWLEEYAANCESLRYRFVDCARLSAENSPSTIPNKFPELSRVEIVPVEHRTEAYGIVLSHTDGWKLTYSGDTEPCQSLVDAGKDSTLLIHEATFEDGMEEEAREKHHSTCGQALDIAERMKAKNILLTHFSQRYAKLPVMNNGTPVAVAFDHMQVHPDDIPTITKLLPKLQLLFPEESK